MKKTIKFALIFAALFGLGTAAFASPIDNNSAVGIVGFTGGDVTYGGLQYQHWFGNHGFTVEGFTTYDEKKDSPFWYQLNFEYGYKLFEFPVGDHAGSRLSLYGAMGSLGWTEFRTGELDFKVNAFVSAGFVVDTMFLDHISIPVKVGLCGSFPNEASAGICVGSGIRFIY